MFTSAAVDLQSHAFTDTEAKFNMGDGYVFFEITEPEELTYTYKINPADFAEVWVRSGAFYCVRSQFLKCLFLEHDSLRRRPGPNGPRVWLRLLLQLR